MIRIVWSRTKHDNVMEIRGHANYAEHGKDIVCASVSAIAYSLLGYLERMQMCSDCKVSPGDMRVQAPRNKRTDIVYDMAYMGLKMIAEPYPRYVDCQYIAE